MSDETKMSSRPGSAKSRPGSANAAKSRPPSAGRKVASRPDSASRPRPTSGDRSVGLSVSAELMEETRAKLAGPLLVTVKEMKILNRKRASMGILAAELDEVAKTLQKAEDDKEKELKALQYDIDDLAEELEALDKVIGNASEALTELKSTYKKIVEEDFKPSLKETVEDLIDDYINAV